jgi:hypothetical protein
LFSNVKYCFQSAPTLLLTTIGLLFTGELLDHVSVRSLTFFDVFFMVDLFVHVAVESHETSRSANNDHTCRPQSERKP